ncbi:hypothetical protein J3R83DRAFT_9028 [Lanmaoa asiatica]|nr:hypothetical protein J3R83DRAFT_9028 [Lanmaoa asiatica]
MDCRSSRSHPPALRNIGYKDVYRLRGVQLRQMHTSSGRSIQRLTLESVDDLFRRDDKPAASLGYNGRSSGRRQTL